ncbi:hypothetical protein D9M70_412330 [compost metagenome]
MGDAGAGKARQVIAGEAVVQLGQGLVGGRQGRFHVGAAEQQRAILGIEPQRRLEHLAVRLKIGGLRTLQADLQRVDRPSGHPAAEGQAIGHGGLRALPGRRQAVAMDRQAQLVALGPGGETEVGPFGDDPLVAHQPGEALLQGAAGHQRIAHHMEGCRAHHLGHVQADGGVAGQFDGAQPEAGHAVLGEARVGVAEGLVVEAEFGKQVAAVHSAHFQGLDYPQGPVRRCRAFAHGAFLF